MKMESDENRQDTHKPCLSWLFPLGSMPPAGAHGQGWEGSSGEDEAGPEV